MRPQIQHSDDIYSIDVFNVLFDYEVTRSRRYPSPLTLLKIEMTPTAIDSALLANAASVFIAALNSHLRSVDISAKEKNIYHILLPASDENVARIVCERLLSVFKNKIDIADSALAFTLQIGATSHGGGAGISGPTLFQNADEALKQSKLKGPNTYIILV
ncbi:MAG: diguanylate cyclase [Chloroflexi bacterium]|nr:diguanylate cyclase [Chloroflexota bacterium]